MLKCFMYVFQEFLNSYGDIPKCNWKALNLDLCLAFMAIILNNKWNIK